MSEQPRHMRPEQALANLDMAAAAFQGVREQHDILKASIQVLRHLIADLAAAQAKGASNVSEDR